MKNAIIALIFIIVLIGGGFVYFGRTESKEDSLENFLAKNNASSEIAEAYRFAQKNPQGVLTTVKCYCGCLKNGYGHKNNKDCFFNEDGTFDLMGLNCGLCVKTALLSKTMLAQGKSVQEISDYVDGRWGKNK